MKQILCFGDSNTWGYDGESRERLPWGVRWTSLLQEKLNKEEYRVIEEGLCGRTTVFEDPLRDGRKGTALLPTLLETHAQADVITLMLGTNDCKTVFGASADVIGKGIKDCWIRSRNTHQERKSFSCLPSIWEKKYGRKDMTRSFPESL